MCIPNITLLYTCTLPTSVMSVDARLPRSGFSGFKFSYPLLTSRSSKNAYKSDGEIAMLVDCIHMHYAHS